MGVNLSLLIAVVLLAGVIPWLMWRMIAAYRPQKKLSDNGSATSLDETPITTTLAPTLFDDISFSGSLNVLPTQINVAPGGPRQKDLLSETPQQKIYIMAQEHAPFMGYELWQALQSSGFVPHINNDFVFADENNVPLLYLTFFPMDENIREEDVGAWKVKGLQLLAADNFSSSNLLHLHRVAEKLAEELSGKVQEIP